MGTSAGMAPSRLSWPSSTKISCARPITNTGISAVPPRASTCESVFRNRSRSSGRLVAAASGSAPWVDSRISTSVLSGYSPPGIMVWACMFVSLV
jgi:hypothetical protein